MLTFFTIVIMLIVSILPKMPPMDFKTYSTKVSEKNYQHLLWHPKKNVIDYETTAIAIGEAALREMYGDERVNRFLPYSAYDEEYEGEEAWCIKGKPIVYVKGGYQVDGPIVVIRKYDGAILLIRYMN